jgi:hypothetical protein
VNEQGGLAVMLERPGEMLAWARREQQRLRLLVAQDAATARQILPILVRLERVAAHNRHIACQLRWICQDMQRDGLTPTQPERRPEH